MNNLIWNWKFIKFVISLAKERLFSFFQWKITINTRASKIDTKPGLDYVCFERDRRLYQLQKCSAADDSN